MLTADQFDDMVSHHVPPDTVMVIASYVSLLAQTMSFPR